MRPRYKISELDTVETLLNQYSHGTRFNWDALLGGDKERLEGPSDGSGPQAINVLTAIEHLSKRSNMFKGIRAGYDMFSDFAHPNMASHSLFLKISREGMEDHEYRLDLAGDKPRAEFVIVLSLDLIRLCLGNLEQVTRRMVQVTAYWLSILEGHLERLAPGSYLGMCLLRDSTVGSRSCQQKLGAGTAV